MVQSPRGIDHTDVNVLTEQRVLVATKCIVRLVSRVHDV